MNSRTYTTGEAAKKLGVSRQTLYTWIEEKRIDAPEPVRQGLRLIRFWTEADIQRAREFKGTLRPGPKRGAARRRRKIVGRG